MAQLRLFLSDEVPFSSESMVKIKKILTFRDVKEVIVLPDVHSKPDNPFPTGIVILSSSYIYPSFVGQEIGCGIRILGTSLNIKDLDRSLIEPIFKNIKMYLRDEKKTPLRFSKKEFQDILTKG